MNMVFPNRTLTVYEIEERFSLNPSASLGPLYRRSVLRPRW